MSLSVINDYENLKLKNFLRVIILDNGNLEETKISIDSVKFISDNINISIFSKNNLFKEYNNVETVSLDYNENYLVKINELLSLKHEEFFCILNSGDLLLDSFKEEFGDFIHSHNVGAIIFDDYIIHEERNNFKLPFSPDLILENDYIYNSVFIRISTFKLLKGFEINLYNNFIRDFLFRLYLNDFEILKKDMISFKINVISNNYTLNEDEIFIKKQLDSQHIQYKLNKVKNNIKPVYDTKNQKASIIIPFKDQASVTKICVESILKKTEYENYEIILINNNSEEKETFELLANYVKNPKIKVLNFFESFNWSKINNFGSLNSSGDILVFLNNDTEVISENWLSLLIGDALQEKTGVVGAKLFYPDNTIQHAGVVIGLNSLASHLFSGIMEDEIPDIYKNYRRNVSSVTGACLAIKKKLFAEINGFNERFEVSFSDIEICLRLLEKGYNNIFNPDVKLFHHEMKTRSKKEFREIDRILGFNAFNFYFKNGDPFFNKNFSLNNAKELTLAKENEVPGFKKYWDSWSKNRNVRIDKIHNLIEKHKIDNYIYDFSFSQDDIINNGILMDKFFKNPNVNLYTALWFIPNFNNMNENLLYDLFVLPNFLSIMEETKNIFVLSNENKNKSTIIYYIEKYFPSMKYEILVCENMDYLPVVDVAFCFDSKTSYKLLKFYKCEAKFYIMYDSTNSSEDLYRMPSNFFDFICISNSQNLVNLNKKYNPHISYFNPIIQNKIYFVEKNLKKINKSLFFHAGDLSKEELNLGFETLRIIKEYFGKGIKIFIEGVDEDDNLNLNFDFVNLGIINSSRELSKYYNQCQVVLNFTSSNHTIKKILNSMACGCVNITNFDENLPTYLRNNENIIFTYLNVCSLSEDIIRVFHDVNLREKIVNIGLNTVGKLNSKNELNKILKFIRNPNSFLEENYYLGNEIEFYIDSNDINSLFNKKEKLIRNLIIEKNNLKNNERELNLINYRSQEKIMELNLINKINEEKIKELNRENYDLKNNEMALVKKFSHFFKNK